MKSHSSLTVVTKKLLFTVGLLFLLLAEAGAVSSNFRVFTPLPVSMERVWSYVAQGETNRLLVWTKEYPLLPLVATWSGRTRVKLSHAPVCTVTLVAVVVTIRSQLL